MKSQTPLHPDKACPVVIRGQGAIEILAFEHPLAGLQLVKGTIESGESSRAAALRELREESGLSASNVSADLGIWTSGYENQIWAFHLCEVDHQPNPGYTALATMVGMTSNSFGIRCRNSPMSNGTVCSKVL